VKVELELEVSGGPEVGKTMSFLAPVITIGRGPKNDLVLEDGLVSQYHGELVLRPRGYIYRDLRSRHGTLVKLDHITVNLHNRAKTQEVSLVDGAQLMLGESVIRVSVRRASAVTAQVPPAPATSPGSAGAVVPAVPEPATAQELLDEHIITRSQDSVEVVARRLASEDARLGSIFRLSRKLNAAAALEDILGLIVEATFEAFPAANFFAITLVRDQGGGPVVDSAPLVARERGPHALGHSAPLLSHSLLEQVATTRESVLFVRDEAGYRVSQSIINARITACLAAPLIGEQRLIGVMQVDTRGVGRLFSPDDLDMFTVVASYAAFAIERVRLNDSIVAMFEGFVRAAVSAVDARDPSTAGHSERVADYTTALARAVTQIGAGPLAPVGFSDPELLELRYAALLHDFGKLGVQEAVLTKAERLYPGDRRTLEERFETLKVKRAYDVQRRCLESLARGDGAADPALLANLDREVTAAIDELDRLRDFVLSAQHRDELSPDVIERLREIGAQRWGDVTGVSRPLLTPRELEHLCVPRGTLTDAEWEHMKAHAAISREVLAEIPWSEELSDIPCIVGWHHEKLDGSGYPDGLKGAEIPWAVRVLTIADIYDALTAADRPYRRALSVTEALDVLTDEARRGLLDSDLVTVFIERVVATSAARRVRRA
jgi:HD-GYP domain-containing protein (c-di-GMP phosphodiesterase class II)